MVKVAFIDFRHNYTKTILKTNINIPIMLNVWELARAQQKQKNEVFIYCQCTKKSNIGGVYIEKCSDNYSEIINDKELVIFVDDIDNKRGEFVKYKKQHVFILWIQTPDVYADVINNVDWLWVNNLCLVHKNKEK